MFNIRIDASLAVHPPVSTRVDTRRLLMGCCWLLGEGAGKHGLKLEQWWPLPTLARRVSHSLQTHHSSTHCRLSRGSRVLAAWLIDWLIVYAHQLYMLLRFTNDNYKSFVILISVGDSAQNAFIFKRHKHIWSIRELNHQYAEKT